MVASCVVTMFTPLLVVTNVPAAFWCICCVAGTVFLCVSTRGARTRGWRGTDATVAMVACFGTRVMVALLVSMGRMSRKKIARQIAIFINTTTHGARGHVLDTCWLTGTSGMVGC